MAGEVLEVLLIEDNPGDARLIEEMLREAGELPQRADASVATGGELELHHSERLEAGLAHLHEAAVDVVLLDLHLPDSAGLETLEAVVGAAETVPVVVLTGLDDREVGVRAIEHGAQDYLVKDEITGDLLVRSVHYALERHRQERERERRREQLAALNRLNRIAQDVTHAVITTASREDLERAVCERLVEDDAYRFAWIGEVDRGTGRVAPRIAVDAAAGELEEVSLATDDEEATERPTARAIRTHEVQVVRDVADEPTFEPWREAGLDPSIRSSVAIPIVYEDLRYGVLAVYSDEPGTFSGPEAEILGRIGDVVGHAISAIERRDALVGDTVQELEFTVEGDAPLVSFTSEHAATVRLEHLLESDDAILAYGEVRGAPEAAFREAVERTDAIEDGRVLTTRDGALEVEVVVTAALSLFDALAAHGGSLDTVAVDDGQFRFTTAFPQGRDARRLVGLVEEHCPDASLRARRTAQRNDGDHAGAAMLRDDRLTPKQRTALATAYHAGHFEWPRETTGEEIADRLGVSAATFHEHLRNAERELFGVVFDGTEE